MLLLYIFLSAFLLRYEPTTELAGTCYGYANCSACKNCKYCKHCNSGGACGVCSGNSRKKVTYTYDRPATPSTQHHTAPSYLETVSLPMAAVVEAAKLNVRTGPGSNYTVLTTLYKGDNLEIVDVTYGDWVGVRGLVTLNGQIYRYEGYVYKLYLAY